MKNVKVVFITGTSGTGKTTLTKALESLKILNTIVWDLDQIAYIPKNAEQRVEKTGLVVEMVNKNALQGLNTIVCGVMTPPEIRLYTFADNIEPVFGLLEIMPDTIRKRLIERKWKEQQIEDNVIWAEHLKRFVMNEDNHFFINSENNTPDEIAQKVKEILNISVQ